MTTSNTNATSGRDSSTTDNDEANPLSRASSELKLLRALIDRCGESSPPSEADVEMALESGVGKLMLLEGQRREQASRSSEKRPSDQWGEDHDLVAEIRALREAVAELRTRTNPGQTALLARGFVLRRKP